VVQVVRKSFQPVVPSLIIVPNSSMAYWKGEVQYWLDDNSEVVFYTGPPGARQQIAQNELWLHPGALDGKVRGRVDYMKKRVPKPHIVVISMESMLQVCVLDAPVCVFECGINGISSYRHHATATAALSFSEQQNLVHACPMLVSAQNLHL
jgi:hypothetical protein